MIDFTNRRRLIEAGIIKVNGSWAVKEPINGFQRMALKAPDPDLVIRTQIQQTSGGEPLPPLAVQWREDYDRRYRNSQRTKLVPDSSKRMPNRENR